MSESSRQTLIPRAVTNEHLLALEKRANETTNSSKKRPFLDASRSLKASAIFHLIHQPTNPLTHWTAFLTEDEATTLEEVENALVSSSVEILDMASPESTTLPSRQTSSPDHGIDPDDPDIDLWVADKSDGSRWVHALIEGDQRYRRAASQVATRVGIKIDSKGALISPDGRKTDTAAFVAQFREDSLENAARNIFSWAESPQIEIEEAIISGHLVFMPTAHGGLVAKVAASGKYRKVRYLPDSEFETPMVVINGARARSKKLTPVISYHGDFHIIHAQENYKLSTGLIINFAAWKAPVVNRSKILISGECAIAAGGVEVINRAYRLDPKNSLVFDVKEFTTVAKKLSL